VLDKRQANLIYQNFQTYSMWWWCYATPSERGGAEELHGNPTVGPRSKV